ncbi:MAG: tandem-95 repeat protein [Verrucomicrobiales bacterium]|nr:tandem-95 repeat protein [Verrucomicrobiales bacterium]
MKWFLPPYGRKRPGSPESDKLRFEALEPRVLFSATALEPVEEGAESHHLPPAPTLEQRVIEEEQTAGSGEQIPIETANAILTDLNFHAADIEGSERREVVFISTTVENYEHLLEHLDPAYEVFLIDGSSDGVGQIAAALEGLSGIDAIHLIGHGEEGRLYLGETALDATSMSGQHRAWLEAIGQSLSPDADLLIYGCEFTSGEDGVEAASLLANLTGADVAASVDGTGHVDLGGDWVLETEIGEVDSVALAVPTWNGLLAPISITNTNNATTLANNIIGSGISLVSASYTGDTTQAGTFTSATGYTPEWLAYSRGIILTTGNTNQIPGANSSGGATVDAPPAGSDADLAALGGGTSFDASVLNFTFVPTSNRITMQFTFGSDEYAEYVYSAFNDVMGVWVNGTQVALTMNNRPISVNSINQAGTLNPSQGNQANDPNPSNGVFDSSNPNLYNNNNPGSGTYNTGMDGFTVTLSFVANVNIGVNNTIKIGITDIGDAGYDSWLFIREDGLTATTIAASDTTATAVSTPVDINVLANDTDSNGHPLTITHVLDKPIVAGGAAVTLPSGSTVKLNTNGTLTFTPVAGSTTDEVFTYTISNGNGTTAVGNVFVDINQKPVNTVAAAQSTNEDTARVITGVSVADVDSTNLTTTLSIPAGVGTLSVVTGGGATITNNGTATVTIAGTAAQINAALASITYTPTADYNTGSPATPFNLTVATSDGVSTDSDTIAITVNPAADIVADAVSTNEDQAVTFNALTGTNGASADNFENGTRAVTAVTQGTNGTVTFLANGSITYTPNANFNGTDSFTYTVTSGGVTETATVNVTISPVNDAPTSVAPSSHSTFEDTNLVITGLSVADIDSTSLTTTLSLPAGVGTLSVVTGGGATISNNGTATVTIAGTAAQINAALASITYVPTADYNTASLGIPFYMTVSTSDGSLSSSNLVAITVTPTADIVADAVSTNEDQAITFNAITGTNGASGDHFENAGRAVTSVTQGTNGTVTFLANGTLTYTPNANYHGSDTFTYTVTSGGVTETATVTVTVHPVNDAPTNIVPTAQSTNEDTNRVITGVSVADVDGGTLTTTLSIPVGAGTLSVVTGGGATITNNGTATVTIVGTATQINAALASITYVPTADYNTGTPATPFNLTVLTSDSLLSASNTVAITVNPVADIVADTVTTNEDQAVTFNALTGTNGASADNFENGTRAVTAVTQGTNGTVTFLANGSITYTPNANYHGSDSFTYTVTSGGVTETATVNVTIAPVNDAPTNIVPTAQSTNEDTNRIITGVSVADVDGGTLTTTLSIPVGAGTLSVVTGGGATITNNGTATVTIVGTATQINAALASITYVPTADYHTGTPATPFNLTVLTSDGSLSASNTVAITVNSVADIVADTVTTNEDQAVTFNALTGTNGASADNFENGARAVTAVTQGTNGTVTFLANGSITYTPNANYHGSDSFTYTVTSGGVTETATVNVTIAPVNDAPVTVGSIGSQAAVDGATIAPLSVTGFFTDVDGDALTYSASNLPPGLAIHPTSGLITGTITTSASVGGPYTVVVTAQDPSGSLATQTFVWTVSNPAPVAVNDSFGVDEGDAAVLLGNVVGNDSDPDGDSLTVVAQGDQPGSQGGRFTIDTSGNVVFDPNGDFEDLAEGETRQTSFVYTLVDADGATSTATVIVTVTGENDVPVAVGTLSDRESDDGDVVAPWDVTSFFDDADLSDTLTYTVTGLPPGLSLDSLTGVVSGTIDVDASTGGPYLVQITATDPEGASVTQTFAWTVNNPAPVAQDDDFAANEGDGAALVGNAISNDSDPDGDSIQAQPQTGVAGSQGGVFSIDANGNVTFDTNGDFEDLAEGETRETSFTYTLVDADGATSTATVTVTVTGENDAPVTVGLILGQTNSDSEVVTLDVSGAFADPDALDVLTYSAGTTLPPGLTIDANSGLITGTLDSSASAGSPYVVVITATDPLGATVTQSFTWTVGNPGPVGQNDQFGADEDDGAILVGNALGNDSDPDGDVLTAVVQSGSSGSHGGLFSMDANGNVTFDANGDFEDLAEGETRETVFTYTVLDADGATNTATVTVTVTGQNDAPLTVGAILNQTNNDSEVISLDVSGAFGDPDTTDALTYSANGTLPPGLVIDADTGVISGTLDSSASVGGPYTVTITATDPEGASVTQTFTWTVNNPAPVAQDDAFAVNEDDAFAIVGNVITANDSDSDGDALAAQVQSGVAGSQGGLFSIDANGNVTFDPNGDFEGLAEGETRQTSFTYTVEDADGSTDTATVTVTVTGQNDAPITVGSIANQTGNDSDVVNLNVGSAFGDPDATDTLTYSANGTLPPGLTIDADTGVISGTLDSSASAGGPYTVTITATDPEGATVTQTFTWTVNNPAPVAVNDDFVADEDDVATIVGDALTNDSDPDGDVVTVLNQSGVSGSQGGLFSIDANGHVTFDPNGDFEDLAEGETRQTSFTYTLVDADGATSTATVAVTVTGENDAPVTVGSIADQTNNDREVISLNVSSAFGDPDTTDALTYSANGTLPPGLTIDADTGIISGTLASSASTGGPYTVTVTATDSEGATVTQTFTWTVNNPAPLAQDDAFAVNEDDAIANVGNVITANDSDPDGDALATQVQSGVAGSQGGLFSIDGNGNVTFDPNGDFEDLAEGETRQTTFTYTLVDVDGATDTATVTVTVTGQNDAPVALGSILNQANEDSEFVNLNVSSAFGDPDTTDALTYSANGTLPPGLTIDADTGVISGTLDSSASAGGPYTVTVTATDPEGASVTQTFFWTVNNPAPMAVNDEFVAAEDDVAAIVGNALGNDSDPDGDALVAQLQSGVAGSQGGLFSIDANGNVTFDPDGDFEDLAEGETRQTSFTYTLVDADGAMSTAIVTVTVTGRNDAPVTVGAILNQANNDGEVIILNVGSAFGDPDATDALTYSANGTLPPGLTIDADTGIISGTLASSASASGPYTVTVTATDSAGASVTQTFLWTVNNPAPIAQGDAFAASEDNVAAIVGNALGNDSDPDGDALVAQLQSGVAGSQGGIFSIDANGNVTFDPNGDFEDLAEGETRQTTFTYTLVDAEGAMSTATVTVTVTGQNDAPVAVGSILNQTNNDSEVINLNFSSAFGDPDTTDVLTYSANGTLPPGLTIDADTGVISGTLDSSASASGPYTVTVTATDPEGVSVTQTFLWTVNNPAPAAQNDGFGASEDAIATVVGNALANDVDADSDLLTAAVQTGVAGSGGGLFSIAANGDVTFHPDGQFEDLAQGETRTTSFQYTVIDADGATSTATVTVTVTGQNDAPVLIGSIADRSSHDSDVILLDVSGAFADGDASDILTFTATDLPAGLIIDSDTGVISGTIDSSASVDGPYHVIVTAHDGHGGMVTLSFLWTVTNPVPVAAHDAFTAQEDQGAILVGNALANDSDSDGDDLSVQAQTNGVGTNGGLFTVSSNGDVTFHANGEFEDLAAGETRQTSFTYTLVDADGATSTATITVTVNGQNDAPVSTTPIAGQSSNDSDAVILDVSGAFADPDASDVLTYSVNGTLPPGLMIDAGTGVISGTLDSSASVGGPYLVEVTATDTSGASVTRTFLWTVGNPAPVAEDDGFSADEDAIATVVGNALGNDSDPDGDSLTAQVLHGTAGSHGGLFSIDANGNVSFDPNGDFEDLAEGETRQTRFTYTAIDADGGTSEATVTVTVTGRNDAPETVGFIADQTSHDSEVISLNVSATFGDPDTTDALTYSANGTLPPGLSIDADTGLISGILDSSASAGGPYTVIITATDLEGASVTQTFLWVVNNPAPAAQDDSFTANAGDAAAIVGNAILNNDSDADGDALSALVQTDVAGSQGGLFSIDANGNVTFDPNGAFEDLAATETRQTSFSYTVVDTDGSTSEATVTVTVTGRNDAPVAVGTIPSQNHEDRDPVTLDVSGAFADPDVTDVLTYSANGTLPPGLTIDADSGVISGILDSSASAGGPYTVIITATDLAGASVTQTFTWTVSNPGPIAQDDAFSADEETVAAVVGNVIGNDSDPDADVLTTQVLSAVSGDHGGLFSIDAAGNVTFTANGDFEDLAAGETRQTSFTYTVVDADGATSTAVVTVTVTGVNDAPIPVGAIDSQTNNDSDSVTLDVSGAFGDPDAGDTLTFSANGTLPPGLMIDADTGIISGTLDSSASASAPYLIQITAIDSHGATVTQTFLWTIKNPAPLAVDDTFAAGEDDGAAIVGNAILGNDTDSDGDALTASTQVDVAGTHGGLFTIDLAGNVTFDPNGQFEDLAAGETRQTSFTYTLVDADGATSSATVTVTVTGANDAPVIVGAIPDQADKDSESVSIDVSTFFEDVDQSDALVFAATGLPAGLAIDPQTGVISGTLSSSASVGGPYQIDITVEDGKGGSVTQSFTWVVSNPAPIAGDDFYTVGKGSGVVVVGNAIAGNDLDPDGDGISTRLPIGQGSPHAFDTVVMTGVAGSQGGTFAIDANGNITFDPGTDFDDLVGGQSRQTTFIYLLSDADGATSTATVTVTVLAANTPPAADSGSLTVPIGSSGGKLGLEAPADPEGDVLTIQVSSLPKVGVLRLANGKPVQVGQFLSASQLEKLVYDAPASYKGKKPVFFRYLVSDGQFSTEAVVKIRIVKSKLIIRCKPGVTNSMPPSLADQPQKNAQKTPGATQVKVQK